MDDKRSENSKQLETHILKQHTWEQLPSHLKQFLGNSRIAWRDNIVKFSLRHQLRWKTNLVRGFFPDERQYYLELVKHSRSNLMLYPYHLSDVLVKGLKISPFRYYLEMMSFIMEEERSYDTLPNFTAADGVRLLGIGRNQYIDIMNKCRQKSWIWNRKSSMIKALLPDEPVKTEIEPWWVVNIGYIGEDDIKGCDGKEKAAIDRMIDHGPQVAGKLRRGVVHSLFRKNLIYLDIPIDDNDQIIVPPLEGFVMNRVLGDYFETLLYKIFVSIDERTNIQQLASVLQINIDMVKMAVSLYIRLGFAKKKDAGRQRNGDELELHSSWTKSVHFQDAQQTTKTTPSRTCNLAEEFQKETDVVSGRRVGFIFDSTITAFLMMGNLAGGLKSHAVTMFEVGKLADEVMDDFLSQLDTVEAVSEGEAQRYFDHAICLRNTIRFLRYNTTCPVAGSDGGLDLLRCERLESLEKETRMRILRKNYALLISMAPISEEMHTITSCLPRHIGPIIPEASRDELKEAERSSVLKLDSVIKMNSPWFKLFLYNIAESGPPSHLFPMGYRLQHLPSNLMDCDYFLVTHWLHDPTVVACNSVLVTINDLLLSGPVLLQAYSWASDEAETVDVPFPDSSSPLPVVVPPIDRQLIANITDKLHLEDVCGYIRLLKYSSRDGDAVWVPLDLHFGIPLFSISLNEDICARVLRKRTFSEEGLTRFSRTSRTLALRVLHFVRLSRALELDSDVSSRLPLPTHHMCFQQGVLSHDAV